MDLLGSIMGSMDKPPTPSEREKKMQKALQAKMDRRLEAEQKKRAKFRTEAEGKVKEFVSDDQKKELPFPRMAKVYRAILHDVAEAAGLFSHSTGEGEEKEVIITKAPAFTESSGQNQQRKDDSETTPTATPPASDYRQKYQHLIGGLDCAEKTAVRMEPNSVFGYVPSANKRDHRSIEQTMNDLRTRKKPRLDETDPSPPSISPSLTSPPSISPSLTSPPSISPPLTSHDGTQSPNTIDTPPP